MKVVRSYVCLVETKPERAVWRDGLFYPADAGLSDGRVIDVIPCEDALLRSIYATWIVELDDRAEKMPSVDQTMSVAVDLKMGASCGLIVTR